MNRNGSTKKKNYTPADKNLMNAIIVCTGDGNIGNAFKKYHNIPKSGKGYDDFLIFAKKFPGITHINFYEKVKLSGQQRGSFIKKIPIV